MVSARPRKLLEKAVVVLLRRRAQRNKLALIWVTIGQLCWSGDRLSEASTKTVEQIVRTYDQHLNDRLGLIESSSWSTMAGYWISCWMLTARSQLVEKDKASRPVSTVALRRSWEPPRQLASIGH